MIVLGNPEFAVGMMLAGVKESFIIRKREEALQILKNIDRKEFIIVNVSILKIVPELSEFRNVITFPDNADDFSSTDDLSQIIKSAVGIDIKI